MKSHSSLCPTCQRPQRLRSKMTACPYCVAAAMSADLGLTSDEPTVAGFELKHILGQGSAGVVWFALESEPPNREVALKILKPGLAAREVGTRFQAEMKALAMMDHPSIAKVFSSGLTLDERPYFAMEWIDGEPLTLACHNQKLATHARLAVFEQICSAIAHAHERGIIHRDLKPSNILLGIEGLPKVIDFGVARATETLLADRTLVTRDGQMIGTPAYMSPEQAAMRGELLDERSDIYSLGVILFELLTDKLPINRALLDEAPYDEVLREIRTGKTPDITKDLPAGLSGAVGRVVSTALAKKREDRFQSVAELSAALKEAIQLPHVRTIGWQPWAAALVVAGGAAIALPSFWERDENVPRKAPSGSQLVDSKPSPLSKPESFQSLDHRHEAYWLAKGNSLIDQDPGSAIAAWAEARRIALFEKRPASAEEARRLIDETLAQLSPDFATSVRLFLARDFHPIRASKPSFISVSMRDLEWTQTEPSRDSFRFAAATLGISPWDRVRWGRAGREAFRTAQILVQEGQKEKAIQRIRCGLVMCSIADQPQELMIAASSALAELEGRDFEDTPLSEIIAKIPNEEVNIHAELRPLPILWLQAFRTWSDPDSPALVELEHHNLLPGWRPLILKARGLSEAASEKATEELAEIDPEASPYLAKVLRDLQQ